MIKIIRIIISLVIILALGWMGFILWQQFFVEKNLPPDSLSVINGSKEANQRTEDLIKVFKPQAQQIITSPVQIVGEAKGYWFFEASFPVKLLDSEGNELAQGIAQANPLAGGDWLTEDFVPFVATLTFTQPVADSGTLILQNNNPSGLPEYDVQISIPVIFGMDNKAVEKPCVITGCSKQLCAEEEVITICDFKPEYICYTKAVCERQLDGQCGWTQTPDLEICLSEFAD